MLAMKAIIKAAFVVLLTGLVGILVGCTGVDGLNNTYTPYQTPSYMSNTPDYSDYAREISRP